MNKANLRKCHNELEQSLERLSEFASRILKAKRDVGDAEDKRDLMEAFLLRACSRWERFVEEQLVACVNRFPERLGEHLAAEIPPHPSKELCRVLLFGNGYRNIKKCSDLKKFAKKVLPDGRNPFENIKDNDSKLIDDAFEVRNYLSHRSHHSRRTLSKIYKDKYRLKNFLEPGRFLVAYDGRRLLAFIEAFRSASKSMSA
jgi:hypothetical protein